MNIFVDDGVGGAPDQYAVFGWEGTADGLGDHFTMSMLLRDDSGTAITRDALPPVAPDIERVDLRSFRLAGQYTDLSGQFIQYEVLGTLSPATTVPQPAPLAP